MENTINLILTKAALAAFSLSLSAHVIMNHTGVKIYLIFNLKMQQLLL